MVPQRILLIQLRQLGDILLTTPVAKALRQAYPNATIDFLCHPMGRLVLADNPYLSEIITYAPNTSWSGALKQFGVLRKKRYDIVFDFMNNPRSAIFTAATGAPKRVSFVSKRQFAYTDVVPRPTLSDYIVREKFTLLHQLGIEASDIRLLLPWKTPDLERTKDFLADYTVVAQAPLRIVLSPTHRREPRQWPLERYAALADHLVRSYQAAVIWLWGPGEQELVTKAYQLCQEKTFLAPQTSFREMAALVAQCDLFIGNSNGPSHVAVAANCPSLQLHGPTEAKAWCPFTATHQALQAGPENLPPGGPIEAIQSPMVYAKVAEMIPLSLSHARLRNQEGFVALSAHLP